MDVTPVNSPPLARLAPPYDSLKPLSPSDDDLNAQAFHWLETEANVRSHGTLKERPVDRF